MAWVVPTSINNTPSYSVILDPPLGYVTTHQDLNIQSRQERAIEVIPGSVGEEQSPNRPERGTSTFPALISFFVIVKTNCYITL